MNYHDYIWDLGGTLLDNYGMSTRAFVQTLAEFGLSVTHNQVYEKLRQSTDIAIASFIPDQPAFYQAYKANEAKLLENPALFEGASQILAIIVQSGGRNFLISHRNDQVLDLLDKTDINHYFTEVVTSDNGFARKPNPESMIYLKEKYGIEQALVIGDRDLDIQAGQAAGFDTLLVDGTKSLLDIVR